MLTAWNLKVRASVLASDGGVGVEDAVGEVGVGLDLGVGPEEAVG